MYILSIDIGLYHMGIVGSNVNEDYTIKNLDFCDLIDITIFKCDRKKCRFGHSKLMADYIFHFLDSNNELFEKANFIIIERQPPGGLIVLEQLIMFAYRNKCHLVSPNSMHKHYSLRNLDYDQRKIRVVKLTENILKKFDTFNKMKRKHDMADAYLILRFFLFNKNKKYEREKNLKEWKKNNHKFIKDINKFRYDPNN